MRLLCALVGPLLFVLSLAFGGDGSAAGAQFVQLVPAPERQLVIEAKVICGTFDGKWGCKHSPGGATFGKNATPGTRATPDDSPEGVTGGDPSTGTDGAGDTGQPSVATPDAPKTCPQNSELLGGHCIPYTQNCRNGLAADANPQACTGAEEKQVCNFRPDGLKDCCCRTYDKF
jgi:hypothetical protein